jgi:thiol-disulfide isomerase/thioredoxin
MRILKGLFGPLLAILICATHSHAQRLDSISMLNTDSSYVKLGSFAKKKALVLVFTGNHCVYSKKYEDRLIKIANEFISQGVAFCLVNSNDPELSQDDRWALMRERATEKKYPCPYLQDVYGELAKQLGASKNPEVFVLRRGENEWDLIYSGKIDDNPLIEERVERRYLVEVLKLIVAGDYTRSPSVPAVGCNIKFKD